MRIEVLSGIERRRRWSRDEKMRILAESLEPGATVADVARRNDVAQSVLFSWRQARLPDQAPPAMVLVSIAASVGAAVPLASKARRTRGPAKERGLIEIDLGGGRRVRVDAGVDADAVLRSPPERRGSTNGSFVDQHRHSGHYLGDSEGFRHQLTVGNAF